jgi:hypothetical protein
MLIDQNLLKLNYVKTAHAYAVKSTVFDTIIAGYDNVDWNNQWNWSLSNDNRLTIDIWYVNNIQKKYNVYGIYPGLAQQRTSYSDIIYDIAGESRWNINDSWNYSKNINCI